MEDDYFIEYDTLANVVDALIKQKYQDEPVPDNIKTSREESIKRLDDQISKAFFNNLTDEQIAEVKKMLDRDAPQEEIHEYFYNLDIDMSEVIAKTIQEFGTDFIGADHE